MSDKVLFISPRCDHSKKVLIGMKKYPFMKGLFEIVNIDTTPYPNYVKTVPCLLSNGQLITGDTVFEYFGKLVEGKESQEEREKTQSLDKSDEGQCRINSDGGLEGWCGESVGIGYSVINEDNDDYTTKNYKMQNALSFLEGSSDSTLQYQVKDMEIKDEKITQKSKQFDDDYTRLQNERDSIGAGVPRT
jgi:hypothetical protein